MFEEVRVQKEEYLFLKSQSEAFKKLRGALFEAILNDSVEQVVKDFKETGLYTEDFLSDFENGLKKSSYINR